MSDSSRDRCYSMAAATRRLEFDCAVHCLMLMFRPVLLRSVGMRLAWQRSERSGLAVRSRLALVVVNSAMTSSLMSIYSSCRDGCFGACCWPRRSSCGGRSMRGIRC